LLSAIITMMNSRSTWTYSSSQLKFMLWPISSQTLNSPEHSNHHSSLCFCEFNLFRFHTESEITGHLCLCAWLILFNTMSFGFVNIIKNYRNSFFLWLDSIPLYVWAVFPLSVNVLMGHLDSFHISYCP
jgi:hypothetical protein